jgi:hypothetical protein
MSIFNQSSEEYTFLVGGSSFGSLPVEGFKSGLMSVGTYSLINVSFQSIDTNTILKIYQAPTQTEAEENLLFQISIPLNKYFYKRFQIQGGYYSIEVVNEDAAEGSLFLSSSASANSNFSASTFLNSKMTINENTSLMRVGNSYHNDLIRGMHQSFKKVNIQGIVSSTNIGTSELTIGLTENFTFNTTGIETFLYVASANDNYPAGTGGHTIKIDYILDTGVADSSTYQLSGPGSGGITLNILAINRATVVTSGNTYKNDGLIVLQSYTGKQLSLINAGENVSHVAVYRVPDANELLLREINICGSAPSGILRVIEIDSSTNMEYSLGDFQITTTYQQITYNLDGLIPSGNIIKVNFIPSIGAPVGQVNINLNVNAVLCPLISTFPENQN